MHMVWTLSSHAKRRFYTLTQTFQAYADLGCTRFPAILLFSFNASLELQWYGTVQTRSNVIEVTVLQNHLGFIYSMDVFHEAGTTDSPSKTETLVSRDSVGFHSLVQDPNSATQLSTLNILATAMDRMAKTSTSYGESDGGASLYNLEALRKREQEDPSRV